MTSGGLKNHTLPQSPAYCCLKDLHLQPCTLSDHGLHFRPFFFSPLLIVSSYRFRRTVFSMLFQPYIRIGLWTNYESDGSATLTLTLPNDWAFVVICILTLMVENTGKARKNVILTVSVVICRREMLEHRSVHMPPLPPR